MKNRIAALIGGILIGGMVTFFFIPGDQANIGQTFVAISTNQGGTGTTTVPAAGQVLVGLSDGTYAPRATSTLGASFTVSATGLEVTGTDIALTAGYNIPLTASTTNWNSYYDTPSTRITAGSNLSWTGNTLNASVGSGGSVGTSSIPTIGQLAYWTTSGSNPELLSSIATGTLSTSATGLEFDTTRSLVGGNSTLSLSAGYTIPLTASTTEWATAYGWGDHGVAGYLTTVDISDNTNLAGTANEIVLTDDTLSIHADIARDSELHDAVTLAGTPDYITLSGQVITRNKLTIADDLNTFSSSDLLTLLTDETGTGVAVFGTNPTIAGAVGTGVWDLGGATSFEIPNGADCTVNATGEICVENTTGSSTLHYYDGTREHIVYPYDIISITNIASTSVMANGTPSFDTGTSTIKIRNYNVPVTVGNYYCETTAGTVAVHLSDGTNDTDTIRATTSGVEDDGTIANASFTAREDMYIEVGSTSSGDGLTCTIEIYITP